MEIYSYANQKSELWTHKWNVESNSGKSYVIAIKRDNTWGCSCPHWTRNRKNIPDGKCKHIKYVEEAVLTGHLLGLKRYPEAEEVVRSMNNMEYLNELGEQISSDPGSQINPEPKPAPLNEMAKRIKHIEI